MDNLFITIVIAAFNSRFFLEKCLRSVFTQLPQDVEVIIIDNASGDGTENIIKENYPEVILINNSENKGTSFARNQGIAAAKGEYIMFLDSDAYLKEGFFEKLEMVLKTLPQDVGAVSPKIIKTGSEKVFSCGLRVSNLYRVYDVGKNKDAGAFDNSFVVDGPNTCCGIYKRDVLEELKEDSYFDEDFFFLFEDADLALCLKKRGYKCLFIPDLICYHHGASAQISKEFRRFLCFRNRMFMILKHNKGKYLFLFFLKSFIYDLFRALHFLITSPYSIKAVKEIMLYKRRISRKS